MDQQRKIREQSLCASKHLDEKVARLHLAKISVELDELTDAQAGYLGITKEGPFKAEHYRY